MIDESNSTESKFFRVCVVSETTKHYIVEASDLKAAEWFVIDNEDELTPIYKSENESITSYKTKGDI